MYGEQDGKLQEAGWRRVAFALLAGAAAALTAVTAPGADAAGERPNAPAAPAAELRTAPVPVSRRPPAAREGSERLTIAEAYERQHEGATIIRIDGQTASAELWYSILRDAARPDSPESPADRILTLASGEEITLLFGSRLHAREIWQDGPDGPTMTLHTRWEHLPNIRIQIDPPADQ